MKNIAVLLLAPLLTLIFLAGCDSPTTKTSTTIHFVDGSTTSLDDLSGQWIIINYWAIWCKPCIEEIPELNQLHHKYKHIYVMGIDMDNPKDQQAKESIEKLGIEFPVARQQLHSLFGFAYPSALPTSIIIAPDLSVKAVLMGAQTEDALLETIKKAL